MSQELISIIIRHEGQLCQLAIPKDRQALCLQLIRGCFDDGVLQAVKLPDDWKVIPLSEAIK